LSQATRHSALWEGLRSWLSSGAARSPALTDWDGELIELREVWRSGGRRDDVRGLDLLRRATSLQLLHSEPSGALPALVPRRGAEPRQALESSFGASELEALTELAEGAVPAALRARIHDLRWLLKRDAASARHALAAYLETARGADLALPSQAAAGGDALLRATSLGLEHSDLSGVESVLAELLPRAIHAPPAIALHRFLQVALLLPGPSRAALADLSIARAESELARREFRWGRTFYAHAERALAAGGRESEAQTLAVVRASVLADEARFLRHMGEPDWIPISFYKRAIDELELVPGTSEMTGRLDRERHAAGPRIGPPGVEFEDGRFSTVIEDVLLAADEIDPRLRARFLAALPVEPELGEPIPSGPATLDLFLRRFRARARGRFHAQHAAVAPRVEPAPGVEAAHVGAWVGAARSWIAPLLDNLRRHTSGNARDRSAALTHLLAESSAEFAQRGEVLARGAAACWEGDPVGGLGILVPQLAHLRNSPPVHRLLQGNPSLALVDSALLHHPGGFALAAVVESGLAARTRFTQVAANLVLWWTLCLAVQVQE
jgi:hypothetical protein